MKFRVKKIIHILKKKLAHITNTYLHSTKYRGNKTGT